MLANIRIVLVGTSHPGNIGSSARALKTMGLKNLVLVSPKDFPSPKAIELAAGAEDIVVEARVVSTLQEALADCQLVVATSARHRELSLTSLGPKEFAGQVIVEAEAGQVAIVFGCEQSGLSNSELLQCQYHVMIPANPDYSSLNLAQAVQIICYELRMASLVADSIQEPPMKDRYATVEELEYFYRHLETLLRQIRFLRARSPKRIMPRLRRMFSRIRLERREVRLLRGILTMVEKR